MGASDSVKSLVLVALRQSPIAALHEIEVTEAGDVIMLTGTVASYYFKQLAQEAVISVAGEREIHNDIRVHRPGTTASEMRAVVEAF